MTPETGFALPIGSRDQIIARFHDRLAALCDDPTAPPAMGAAARALIADRFTWARKAEQIAGGVYDWVRGQSPARPAPFLRNPT